MVTPVSRGPYSPLSVKSCPSWYQRRSTEMVSGGDDRASRTPFCLAPLRVREAGIWILNACRTATTNDNHAATLLLTERKAVTGPCTAE